MSNLEYTKARLKEVARSAKAYKPKDKPFQRQCNNDFLDMQIKENNFSDKSIDILESLACSLHP